MAGYESPQVQRVLSSAHVQSATQEFGCWVCNQRIVAGCSYRREALLEANRLRSVAICDGCWPVVDYLRGEVGESLTPQEVADWAATNSDFSSEMGMRAMGLVLRRRALRVVKDDVTAEGAVA